jgi:hypothetical protein
MNGQIHHIEELATMPTDSARTRVMQLMEGPLGCAFFLAAHQLDVPIEQLVRPEVALDIAAKALGVLDPWTGYAEAGRAEVLARAALVETLAFSVISDPRSAWWWQELPRKSQLTLREAEGLPAPALQDAAPRWSAYAQRPPRAFFTSTRFGTTSGLHAAVANRVGDWEPTYPLVEIDVEIADARVYEVTAAADWHQLATTFPLRVAQPGSSPPGIVNDLSPDWSPVAARWDGVHLTFAGLLSASYVPMTTAAGTTTLWTWESERTLWLRQPFVARRQVRLLREELREGHPGLAPVLISAGPAGTRDRGWLRRS